LVAAAFVHGFLLALALILPIGPQNSFILSRSANPGPWTRVLPVVVVASMSDTILIGTAIRGCHWLADAVAAVRWVLMGAGVVFLVWMGVRSWRDVPGAGGGGSQAASALGRDIRYALAVSWLNPHAVLDTVVVLGGGAAIYRAAVHRAAYAMAAILVSWLWFSGLAVAGRKAQRWAEPVRVRLWINRISALIMWGVALHYVFQIGQMLSRS
jgi:L-lysine exporter family protein LysE/ArgO